MSLPLAGSPWGSRSLTLSLPGTRLRTTGLSDSQAAALAQDYPGFIVGPPDSDSQCSPEFDIECQALQLHDWLTPDNASLTRDGQYTPLKQREPGATGFQLIGHNFAAYLDPSAEHSPSQLGVPNETELAGPIVFENVLRVLLAHRALAVGGALLHSAGVVIDGHAFIFCGRSNAGKTTLTRKAHAAGLTVLSDDINLLLPGASGFEAHAVPFTGEFGRTLDHRPAANQRYPVASLLLLEQSDRLLATAVSPAAAAADLLAGSPFVNMDPDESSGLFDAVTSLLLATPVLRLHNRRDDTLAAVLETITGSLSRHQLTRNPPSPKEAPHEQAVLVG